MSTRRRVVLGAAASCGAAEDEFVRNTDTGEAVKQAGALEEEPAPAAANEPNTHRKRALHTEQKSPVGPAKRVRKNSNVGYLLEACSLLGVGGAACSNETGEPGALSTSALLPQQKSGSEGERERGGGGQGGRGSEGKRERGSEGKRESGREGERSNGGEGPRGNLGETGGMREQMPQEATAAVAVAAAAEEEEAEKEEEERGREKEREGGRERERKREKKGWQAGVAQEGTSGTRCGKCIARKKGLAHCLRMGHLKLQKNQKRRSSSRILFKCPGACGAHFVFAAGCYAASRKNHMAVCCPHLLVGGGGGGGGGGKGGGGGDGGGGGEDKKDTRHKFSKSRH